MKSLISLVFACLVIICLFDRCEVTASTDAPLEVTSKSVFYDAFLPENIDQVIESASTVTDQEPDLAASDEHGEEDDSSSKMLKETGHDDKSKKKYKTKKHFHYSKCCRMFVDALYRHLFSFTDATFRLLFREETWYEEEEEEKDEEKVETSKEDEEEAGQGCR